MFDLQKWAKYYITCQAKYKIVIQFKQENQRPGLNYVQNQNKRKKTNKIYTSLVFSLYLKSGNHNLKKNWFEVTNIFDVLTFHTIYAIPVRRTFADTRVTGFAL